LRLGLQIDSRTPPLGGPTRMRSPIHGLR
jgi:hypothetical protein